MISTWSVFFLGISFCLSSFALAKDRKPTAVKVDDVLTWPRVRVDKFGCMLEKELKIRDERFNCSLKRYKNKGSPCKNTEAYYEGPTFPTEKATKIKPDFKEITVSWENGEMQMLVITLAKKYSEKDALTLLGWKEKGKMPPNITDISIQDCSMTATCIVIQGFEHMGAGDVDCDSAD